MEVRLHPLEYTQRDLPRVCAVTGRTADWLLTLEARKSANPLSLLLLFLGPLGWLILLFVALGGADGTTVDVPVSQNVMDKVREKRRRWWIMLVGMAAAVVLFGMAASSQLFPAGWMVFILPIGLAVWTGLVQPHKIRLRLDGAGLVTLRNVHPSFVAAVEQWRDVSASTSPQL